VTEFLPKVQPDGAAAASAQAREVVMSESVPIAEIPAPAEVTESTAAPPVEEPQVAVTDLLVEEVSIDGMCGVY
jgi:mycofactocin precursor